MRLALLPRASASWPPPPHRQRMELVHDHVSLGAIPRHLTDVRDKIRSSSSRSDFWTGSSSRRQGQDEQLRAQAPANPRRELVLDERYCP
jgi:hypothetical protein